MNIPPDPDPLLIDTEVEALTRVKAGTLRKWRSTGKFDERGNWTGHGPAWFRVGGYRVVYQASVVRAWLDDQQKKTTAA